MHTTSQVKAAPAAQPPIAKPAPQPLMASAVDAVEAPSLTEQMDRARLGHHFGAISVLPPDPPSIQPKRMAESAPRLPAFHAMGQGRANPAPVIPAGWAMPPRVQTKLTVGEPNDAYEQEADRVADQVMRMAEPRVQAKCACGGEAGPDGECAACKAQRLAIQRQAQDEPAQREEVVQAQSDTAPADASPDLESRLNGSRGSGQALPADTRNSMESAFGADFGGVRVHTGNEAVQMNKELSAQAFTHGSDIYFNAGKYEPESTQGKGLLAHELTHVVQQSDALLRKPTVRQPDTRGTSHLWRKPNANPPDATPQEEWLRVEVFATGMDAAAQILAAEKLTFYGAPNRQNVFVGLHPKFIKVYDQNGKSLARIPLKEIKGLRFNPGVYIQMSQGLVALTRSSKDPTQYSFEGGGPSMIGQRPFTEKEKKAIAEEAKKAEQENRAPSPPPSTMLNLDQTVTEPERYRSLLTTPANALVIFFAPAYDLSGSTDKGGGESRGIYASPIESRGDGQPANAPPWPVTMDGPKLVPVDSDPTYSAKVDWSANGNYSLAAQVISQVGETIHYKWELFDITQYAKKQLAKDPAATKVDPTNKPEKTLEERIEEFKKAKEGTGADVTGMGGANREFTREFEDWWKDTKRAVKGSVTPGGDTVGERLSNAAANRLSLELAPVALLTTSVGAALRWVAELFAGPRQQQEIPLEKEGFFLIRVITTPGINEDREGKSIIRPPSVAAKVTEVTPMDRAVREALDEPGAQMAELQAQIDLADKAGNTAKAEYLRSLLAEAKMRFEGSPLTLLIKKRNEKQQELEKYRKEYPSLSDYSRTREVEMLDDQIDLYRHHEKKRTEGAPGLAPLARVNATLISEVTGEQYPLLISAGPMAMVGARYRWMISDVTNRDGDAFTGLGDTPSGAFLSVLTKFGGKAAYGRGRIGVRTSGLGLEASAPAEMLVDSAPADWALAEKRLDDLIMTLATLGLIVASAGTAGAVIGAAVAAARMIERWQAGKLYLDAQTVSDVLGVLGGMGAAGQLAGGLRLQKFEKVFAVTQEGRATEAQIARAAEALKGAQQLTKVVEVANEALNYGGLLWGNISFIDQMMSISEQEQSGAITHAAARRARATSISSAVQNNALFIAGNVAKAKQTTSKTKSATPREKTPTETTPPKDSVPRERLPNEPSPKEKSPSGESTPESTDKPTGKAPQAEPVPISERQATPAELRAALPADLQRMFTLDESLQGDTVKVEYKLDPSTGLISEISLRCGRDARPRSVELHTETIRTMQKYQGFSGRVRQAISLLADLIGVDTLKPENRQSFEAVLEIRKLPKLIEAQMLRMKNKEPNALDLATAELDHLQLQLEQNLRALDLGGAGEGVGFVAARGLSKAKQKQYSDLLTKLRGLQPGTESHKKVRREMYELIGGDLPFPTWEKIYDSNVERARKANVTVVAEQARLGWGETEQTVKVGKDDVRRLDIANVKGKKGVEVKAYETGYITASEDIVWEVERDAKLVKRGWEIKWVLVDTEPSGPLLTLLLDARITVELRTRKGGGESQLVIRILPPVKSRPKATK